MSTESIFDDIEYDGADEAVEIIRENRELFERVAASDLPMSVDAQGALDYLDEVETDAA